MKKIYESHCKRNHHVRVESTTSPSTLKIIHLTFKEKNRTVTFDCFKYTTVLPLWNAILAKHMEKSKNVTYNTTFMRKIKNIYSHFQIPRWIPINPLMGKLFQTIMNIYLQGDSQSLRLGIIWNLLSGSSVYNGNGRIIV